LLNYGNFCLVWVKLKIIRDREMGRWGAEEAGEAGGKLTTDH
jgi:hypothetical protein